MERALTGRTVVTGAAGFLGRHVVAGLRSRGAQVVAFDRRGSASGVDAVSITADVGDSAALVAAFEGARTVVHLAGLIEAPRAADFETVNVGGTANVVTAAMRAGVSRLVFMSSNCAVDPLVHGAYGISKARAEALIVGSTLDYVILRAPVIYGPDDDKNLAQLVSLVRRSPIVPVPASVSARFQPVYVEDVVRAVASSMETGASRRAYDLAGPDWLPLDVIVRMIAVELGRRPFVVRIAPRVVRLAARAFAAALRQGMVTTDKLRRVQAGNTYIDPVPAAQAHGYVPTSLRDGLRATLTAGQRPALSR